MPWRNFGMAFMTIIWETFTTSLDSITLEWAKNAVGQNYTIFMHGIKGNFPMKSKKLTFIGTTIFDI